MQANLLRSSAVVGVFLAALSLSAVSIHAQTNIVAPENRYSPEQDVQLGEKAAGEVLQQMPLVGDSHVEAYVGEIGRRLVAAIPAELQHPEFHYTFRVADAKDENAFALPGGPMFVCRGMIQAVSNDAELAGVMAHELSHVALRHGTAQATKATPYEIGEIAGQILGSIVGGTTGQVIAAGSQFGIGTAFLRFSREYEKQADLLGSHIMARAGYDPRQMAAVFQMLEKNGGPGAPEWLSDHPNPGNRAEYIEAEARSLQIAGAAQGTKGLKTVQADLNRLPPAQTMAQLEKDAEQGNPRGNRTVNAGRSTGDRSVGTSGSFPPASSSFRTYNEANLFQVSVPDDWQPVSGNNSVRFSPRSSGSQMTSDQSFDLGVELGRTESQSGDLKSATDQLVRQLMQSNPSLKSQSDSQATTLDGRQALRTVLNNTNEAGQRETVALQTTLLGDGSLFYTIDVAPASQYATFEPVFRRVAGSIRLTER
jgi:beta-barrel assembly-enhancing protease